jgi:hypothetical protein
VPGQKKKIITKKGGFLLVKTIWKNDFNKIIKSSPNGNIIVLGKTTILDLYMIMRCNLQ